MRNFRVTKIEELTRTNYVLTVECDVGWLWWKKELTHQFRGFHGNWREHTNSDPVGKHSADWLSLKLDWWLKMRDVIANKFVAEIPNLVDEKFWSGVPSGEPWSSIKLPDKDYWLVTNDPEHPPTEGEPVIEVITEDDRIDVVRGKLKK